jgi:hypothetical protein
MNIVYAAEKPSIAGIVSEHVQSRVEARDIQVSANPDETGSFLIHWRHEAFVLSPNGDLMPEGELA